MRNNRHRKHPELRFEVIPLIDLMFTLLIFFVIFASTLATYSANKGLNLKLPSAQSTAVQPKAVNIQVDAQNQIYIDGTLIPSSELRFQIQTRVHQTPTLKIHLQADETLAYAQIIHILDEIRLAGCFDISLQAHALTPSQNETLK